MNKVLFFLFFSFISFHSIAQQPDLWQWTTFSVDKKVSSKVFLSFDEEVRLFRNLSQFNLSYTNVGIGYKITKYMKTSVVYRFLQKNQDDGTISFRHRFYVDLALKYKTNPFVFGYRSRLQTQVRDVNSSEKGTVPESYWRNKFDLKYDPDKKWVPYIAAEFRFQLGNSRMEEANYRFNRGRYYVGTEYKLSKSSTLGFYYMLQWEYNVNAPERDSVLGLSYALSL